ncbi:PLAC8-domain-containing protein [Trichodelitschia bisporula]|uniref:PLAC8-domain-containing protein n=1 Tax=Trichodelitschia bisporula TaxID=703511 RepID=A0A6G1HTG5_9PEZI|nr:PLAC8-domain-containing protein [Trichodelitschia bisporula]
MADAPEVVEFVPSPPAPTPSPYPPEKQSVPPSIASPPPPSVGASPSPYPDEKQHAPIETPVPTYSTLDANRFDTKEVVRDEADGLQVVPGQNVSAPMERGLDCGGKEMERERGLPGEESGWMVGFWDCFSPVGLCIEAFTCPCILAGRTYQRIRDPDSTHWPSTNSYCCGCCGLSLLTLAALPCCWIMTVANRREIRYRYHIKGSNKADCFQATLCCCLALIQEEKETVLREKRRKEEQGQAGYGRQDSNMVYAAPAER